MSSWLREVVTLSECSGMDTARSHVVLDHVDKVQVDSARFHNELQILHAWKHGLHFLYHEMRAMEHAVIADLLAPGSLAAEKCAFPNLACSVQWYAVTLCNYVELVGCIGWEVDNRNPPPRDYIKCVVPAVLAYRNYVAAHVARARRSSSNAAERLASLLPPSSLINGRYFAGALRISTRASGTVSDSRRIQPWSLTLMHESLAARYWPSIRDRRDTTSTGD